MGPQERERVAEFIGIYDADGGVRGEAAYLVGKLRGTAHCALCDVTHATVRRKPGWDGVVDRLGVPFALLHRNELDDDVTAAIAHLPLAVVLARLTDGTLAVALGSDALEGLDGDLGAFESALGAAVFANRWELAGRSPGGISAHRRRLR